MLSLIAFSLVITVPDAPARAPSEAPKTEAKVCKVNEPVAGSRLNRRKRCMTADEWTSEQKHVGRYLGRGPKSASN